MKKWIVFLLVAGFVTSNLHKPHVQKESSTSNTILSQYQDNKDVTSEDDKTIHEKISENNSSDESAFANERKNDHHFLLITTDEGKVQKAMIANMTSSSQTMAIAALPKKEINQFIADEKTVTIQEISKDKSILKSFETGIGIPIDNIIVIEKKGYNDLFAKFFPDGIPLHLTKAMKKDLNIVNSPEPYIVNANQFLQTIKSLKETKKYEHEINQMIVKIFSAQLSKPDVVLSCLGIISDIDEYFYTDLTMEELLSIGMGVMKNPVQEVQKLKISEGHDQEVIEIEPNKINPL